MKLSTIAGAATLGLPGAAPSGEAEPSVPFDSVLSKVSSEGSASPADASPSGRLRAGSPSLSPLASLGADTTSSGSDAGAFRQRSDATDQGSVSAAAGPPLVNTRSDQVDGLSTATATPDVLQLATRAAEPIRRAPSDLQLASQVAKAAQGSSAQASVRSPGTAILAQAGSQALHAPAASGRSAPVAERASASTIGEVEEGGLDAGITSPAARVASRRSIDAAQAEHAAAAPDPLPLDGAISAAAAMQGLVPAALVSKVIAAPSKTGPSDGPIRGAETSNAGSLVIGSPDPQTPADGDGAASDPLAGAAAGQPAMAAVVSNIEQIVPGTVEVESHLGFVPAPGAGRLPGPTQAIPSGATEPDTEAAASVSATVQPETIASLAVSSPASGAFDSAVDTHAFSPLRTDGALRTKASAADAHPEASIRDPADAMSPADDVAAKTLPADVGPAHAIAISRGTTSLAPNSVEPTAARAGRPLDATITTATVASIVQPASPTPTSLTQQVADGVVGLAAAAVPESDPRTTQVAAARTMTLQLSPAGLGTLSVRLHVSGRALDVRLEASDGRTTSLIERDRDALADALRSKDYQLQTLSVTTHEATMGGGGHAERGTDPGSSRSSQPHPDDGSQGDQGRRDERGRGDRPQSRQQEEAVVDRAGASLFV